MTSMDKIHPPNTNWYSPIKKETTPLDGHPSKYKLEHLLLNFKYRQVNYFPTELPVLGHVEQSSHCFFRYSLSRTKSLLMIILKVHSYLLGWDFLRKWLKVESTIMCVMFWCLSSAVWEWHRNFLSVSVHIVYILCTYCEVLGYYWIIIGDVLGKY